VGMKSGRYAFEVKIVEALNPTEAAQGLHGRTPQPRQVVRLGFSTPGSSLLLGDSAECAYFDSEGSYWAGKQKTKSSQNFTRDQAIAVVLNLDPSSPLCNTLSLFREGVRIAEPQKLPACLHGKTVCPHICFRNVTVQVNVGPHLLKQLPFTCTMLQAAAAADVEEVSERPKDGMHEVIVPVALPDEGAFDWVEDFLACNPSHRELSDRRLLEWAAGSGLPKPKSVAGFSNDKPSFSFGLAAMDDGSLQRVARSAASTIPRNYVVMEVKSNLLASERAELLKKFSLPHFKKIAVVAIGEPGEEFKLRIQARLLHEKQQKADAEWKAKKAEKERQRQLVKKQKEIKKSKQLRLSRA